MSSNLNMDAVG